MIRATIITALLFLLPASGTTAAALEDGIWVMVGQNLRATRAYYYDQRIPQPAGYSDYISYDVGAAYADNAPDAPKKYLGNDALLSSTNWGSGKQCVDCLLREDNFKPSVINIGMYLAGPANKKGELCRAEPHCNLNKIARGDYDHLLTELALWLNRIDAQVLLRIGYEFDGAWNNYDPTQYKKAFKHIHRYLHHEGVDNVDYVFHSAGYASRDTLIAYFPEPDESSERYVDWIGYSYFNLDPNAPGKHELALARELGVKAFIGEAAPHSGDCADQIDIATEPAQAIEWIDQFFVHIEKNRDVIGAIAYINADWSDVSYSPMWTEQSDQGCNGYFSQSNSRLNDNHAVAQHWSKKISQPGFINRQP
ncbi:hypothetical protein [Gilvimarinus algae]|uniref:GH26 domain-containing protein n=1 Tax=Gilvimarinus algae TaxID=3058037 RepID=A0ABT8TB26_9GAMM|nr:hypothetical protein [Gilvimarinus sp. SDUM040014]MDO3381317.1 hypothetical protein [Gilvimarinus sp. SDUM040014]